ncbi:hypothetical protein D3C76_1367280 [compost metagenome]
MSVQRSSIFGVVPEPTKAWKPEIAPQAIVIEMNGQTGPAITGPPPLINSVIAGNGIEGLMINTPMIKAMKTPIFIKLLK